MDAVDNRECHPLHSRLRQQPPVIAAVRPVAPASVKPTAPAQPAAIHAAPKRSLIRRAGSAVAFSLLGFILGAVFWHFVGFWDFVGQVMFGARSSGTQISQPPPIKLKERVSGVSSLAVLIEPEACVTLQLNRATGTTQSAPCETESLPLRSLKVARREDLWVTGAQRIQEATTRGWSLVTVETPNRPLDQASAD